MLISSSEWTSQYDFVVRIRIDVGSSEEICSGTAWGNKVLTAAHCAPTRYRPGPAGLHKYLERDASKYHVETAHGEFQVSKVDIHPSYQLGGVYPSPQPNLAADYMILTLTSSLPNRQSVMLQSEDLAVDSKVMIAGLGGTGGTNPNHRPVLSSWWPIVGSCNSYPLMCYGGNTKRSCGGDGGGPVLYWKQETCAAGSWPKSRGCAIAEGSGHIEGSHKFVDGTGTWCSGTTGGERLTLEEAMETCLQGSLGMTAPCVGVVFNSPQPGDTGSAYGKYTTCWRTSGAGLGWQVLLKPEAGTLTSCTGSEVQYGDRFVQIGDWRIGDVDGTHFSIAHKYGRTAQIYRSDGTLHGGSGRSDFTTWSRSVLAHPSGISFGDRFIQIGEWRIGDVDDEHASIAHRNGKTAQIFRRDGTLQGGSGRSDYTTWSRSVGTPSGVSIGKTFIQIGEWRIGDVDGQHASMSHKDGKTAQIFRSDGSLHSGPRSDYTTWSLPTMCSGLSWVKSQVHRVCLDSNSQRRFHGIGKTLEWCQSQCVSEGDCEAVYGALGYGDGSCWTFPATCVETSHHSNYHIWHMQQAHVPDGLGTAVVAGALSRNSGGGCGQSGSPEQFASTSGAVDWIKSVAPEFQWTV